MSTPFNTNITSLDPRPISLILVILLVMTAITTGAAFINMGVFSPIVGAGHRLLQGCDGHPLFYAYPLQLESDDAHRRRRLLHLPGVDHDDPLRLHQPQLGSLVAIDLSYPSHGASQVPCEFLA